MTPPPDILQKILACKTQEVMERNERLPLRKLSERIAELPPPRGFMAALQQRIAEGKPAVIAEIKRASPSKGILRDPFMPAAIARNYAQHGATCLSVLTDTPFFQGAPEHLQEARQACELPILRKDFIIDAYQVYEARAWEADCILLIVAALGDATLNDLAQTAWHLEMDVLVEVHTRDELERALALQFPLIGINNRNLHTFETHLDITLGLKAYIPDEVLVVTESGIHSGADVARLWEYGVKAFLVGEAFMRADDPGAQLAALFSHQKFTG